MSVTTEAGLSYEKLQDVSVLVKNAGDEAVQLRIVERFLSEVERRLLKATPQIFDIERIRTALYILKTLTEEDDIDECLEAEFRLDQEFHLWRELIVERDQKIETYHFRRLCDSSPHPLGDEIFIALASFYRTLDFTPATQSKFDLSVTRLFTGINAKGRRETKCLRSEIVSRLKKLFPDTEPHLRTEDDVRYAVSAIDGFIDEALHLGKFEDLVRANLFDRYRVFKRELGSLFFQPEIVAASIECNVAVGNVFDTLLRSADEQLSERLTVDIDLAGALHDPAPESRSHISELFRVFFGEDEPTTHDVDSDVDYLGRLLTVSSSRSESEPDVVANENSTSARGRIAPFLRTLTEARPDHEPLLKQLRRSESLGRLDVNMFLYAAHGEPDVLSRRALAVILWSLEFREHDLKQSREMTEAIQSEATSLLYKAEHLSSALEREIDSAGPADENRLRAVLNALMDSRLKLERGIVRFTNRKFTAPAHPAPSKGAESSDQATSGNSSTGSIRWLTYALVLLLAAAAGVYYFFFFQK